MKTSTASARRGRRPPKICQKKMPHENLNGQGAEGGPVLLRSARRRWDDPTLANPAGGGSARPGGRPPGRPPPTGLLLEHHEIHTFALRRRIDFLGDPGLGS